MNGQDQDQAAPATAAPATTAAEAPAMLAPAALALAEAAALAGGAGARTDRRQAAAADGGGILGAETMRTVRRAAGAAARVYRLARTSYGAEDVAAETIAEMLADHYGGRAVSLRPQDVAVRARRIADRYRRQADREAPAGTAAEMVDPAPDQDQAADQDGSDNGRRNAAMRGTRHQRNMSAERADVLAVGDHARRTMRAAEIEYLRQADAEAEAEALARTSFDSTRTAEARALALLRAEAEAEAPVSYLVRREAAPAAWSAEAAAPASRADRREARRLVRRAEADSIRAARLAVQAAEAADALAPVLVLAPAYVADVRRRAAEALAAAEAAEDAASSARLAAEAASRTSTARTGATWRPVTVEAPARRADVLSAMLGAEPIDAEEAEADRADGGRRAAYVAEALADRNSVNRPRGAVTRKRAVEWSAAIPGASEADRKALSRAVRGILRPVLAAPEAAADRAAYGASEAAWRRTAAEAAAWSDQAPAYPADIYGGASFVVAPDGTAVRVRQARAEIYGRRLAAARGAWSDAAPAARRRADVLAADASRAVSAWRAEALADQAAEALARMAEAGGAAVRQARDMARSAAWRAEAEAAPHGAPVVFAPPPALSACPVCLSTGGRHYLACSEAPDHVAEAEARREARRGTDSTGAAWSA